MSTKRYLNDNDDEELNEIKISKKDEVDNDKNIERKKKKLDFEHLYLNQLPSSECYEKSYMHKESITHVISASKTDFIITGKLN